MARETPDTPFAALGEDRRDPGRRRLRPELVQCLRREGVEGDRPEAGYAYVGSHLLRHSLATRLVNAGASLDEVGEVLRHRSRSSTMIYAGADLDGLRSIAMPWPVAGGAQ